METFVEMTRTRRFAKTIILIRFSARLRSQRGETTLPYVEDPHETALGEDPHGGEYLQEERLAHLVNIFANLLLCRVLPALATDDLVVDSKDMLEMSGEDLRISDPSFPLNSEEPEANKTIYAPYITSNPRALQGLGLLLQQVDEPYHSVVSAMSLTGYAPKCLDFVNVCIPPRAFHLNSGDKFDAQNLARLSIKLHTVIEQPGHTSIGDMERFADIVVADAIGLEYLDLSAELSKVRGVKQQWSSSPLLKGRGSPTLQKLRYLILEGFTIERQEIRDFVSERRDVLEGVQVKPVNKIPDRPALCQDLWSLIAGNNAKPNAVIWIRGHGKTHSHDRDNIRRGIFEWPELADHYPLLRYFWV